MVTIEQAVTSSEFHYGDCLQHIGPRSGIRINIERWRRNGRTKTWVTKPGEFRVPIKYGLYSYSTIDNRNAAEFHAAEDCEESNVANF